MKVILSAILIMTILISGTLVIKKRRKMGLTDIKSALTPICFLLIGIIGLFAYWFNMVGLLTWFISFALLLLGAYFTKYMPVSKG